MSKALSVGPQPKALKFGHDYHWTTARENVKVGKDQWKTVEYTKLNLHPSPRFYSARPTPMDAPEHQNKNRKLRVGRTGKVTSKPLPAR